MKKILLSLLTVFSVCGLSARADEPVVLLDADFSVFEDGSMEEPKSMFSSQVISKIPEISYASGASSAGGCLLIGPSGYLELKAFSNLPTSSGCTLKVTAEVKMADEYGGVVQLYKSYNSYTNIIVENDDWTTISDFAPDFGYTAKLKIQPYLSVSGFYIKSIKVEYSADFVAAPEAYLPNDANGTEFTASWSTVSGASQYELDVFSLNDNQEPVYFMQNEVVKPMSIYSTPSKKVTGLDPETTYYYVVRSVNANGAKSENSEVVEVIKCISTMEAPIATAATNITTTGFTANWQAVDDAIGYQVNCYSRKTIEEASTVTVFNEDFSGVTKGTIVSVSYDTDDLNTMTKVPGWLTDFSKTYAAGYYVIYPASAEGKLVTPAIDLSQNNGKFSISIKAAAGAFGSFYTSDNTIQVSIVEGDDINNLTVIESAEAQKISSKDFIDYTFDFTQGTTATRLLITYTYVDRTSDKLYIDDINVTQNLEAGSVIDVKLGSTTVENVTTADIELDMETGTSYFYTVNSIGRTVLGSGSNAAIGTIMSNESNSITVHEASGVDNVTVEAEAKAWKAGDGIIGVNGSNVVVTDLSGRVLYNAAINGAATIDLNVRGLVIVVVDNAAFKLVL